MCKANKMLLSKHKNHKSRGQGLLEFALALPIFLLLVLGVIEFGRLLAVVSSVTTAAREGARYGSASGSDTVAGPFYYRGGCRESAPGTPADRRRARITGRAPGSAPPRPGI